MKSAIKSAGTPCLSSWQPLSDKRRTSHKVTNLCTTPDILQIKWDRSVPLAPLGAGSPAIGSPFANLSYFVNLKQVSKGVRYSSLFQML